MNFEMNERRKTTFSEFVNDKPPSRTWRDCSYKQVLYASNSRDIQLPEEPENKNCDDTDDVTDTDDITDTDDTTDTDDITHTDNISRKQMISQIQVITQIQMRSLIEMI